MISIEITGNPDKYQRVTDRFGETHTIDNDLMRIDRDVDIVKVQVPLMHNRGKSIALIYNRLRDFQIQVVVTKPILEAMTGASKKYFTAEVRDGQLNLIKEAAWQTW